VPHAREMVEQAGWEMAVLRAVQLLIREHGSANMVPPAEGWGWGGVGGDKGREKAKSELVKTSQQGGVVCV
jgi:hypothetical protein